MGCGGENKLPACIITTMSLQHLLTTNAQQQRNNMWDKKKRFLDVWDLLENNVSYCYYLLACITGAKSEQHLLHVNPNCIQDLM